MSSNVTISTAVANPIRTAVQLAPAAAITEFVDAWVHDMNDRQYAILVVVLGLLFGFIQNSIENYKGKAFLRNVPPTQAPVVDTNDGIEDVEGKHEREL